MPFDPARTALMLVDLQNDFIHHDGAYARGGAKSAAIAALPARLAPLAEAMRRAGGWLISTHFTLVPGRDGEPMISDHLKQLRPFLGRGDFAPGSWGQALVDDLAPSHVRIEKVAFSAFYMSRLDYVLQRAGIETLLFAGIVTNGGVASTLRDAHVRDYECILLEDGCAAFSQEAHQATVTSLGTIAQVSNSAEALQFFNAG
tara:strand:+ start:36 stop:641 length:606 start_codon:yes stop_codon:yes gene_type:complete